jgi:hypothetical protein
LLALGCDCAAMSRHSQGLVALPIHSGSPHAARWIEFLAKHGASVDPVGPFPSPPLSLAAGRGRIDCARALLAVGANPNATDLQRLTPLHRAAWRNDDAMVRLLVENGAVWHLRDAHGLSPLHVAAGSDRLGEVKAKALDALLEAASRPEASLPAASDDLLDHAGFPPSAMLAAAPHSAEAARQAPRLRAFEESIALRLAARFSMSSRAETLSPRGDETRSAPSVDELSSDDLSRQSAPRRL